MNQKNIILGIVLVVMAIVAIVINDIPTESRNWGFITFAMVVIAWFLSTISRRD